MMQPSFFLVGAPKCGTTALCKYLAQHPDVFVSRPKELNYFDTDFKTKKYVHSLPDYLEKFAEGKGKVCGEGSTSYLYSQAAAKNIYQFNPDAKIIIMLRSPVTVMHSFHSQLLFNGSSETVQDFAAAVALETDRKQGNSIPQRCQVPEMLLYREVVSFFEQVKRYFDVFDRDQVKVILFEDFKQETASVYRETLEFIGVSPDFEPSFAKINSNKRARSPLLQSLLKYPPARVLEIGKHLLPMPRSWRRSLLERTKASLKSLNTQKVSRPPIDAELKKRLIMELTPDIRALETLIGRDLSAWHQGTVARQV
ncbi:sulfotransferase domain-containing protein [cf. Phormidesmis sp. LEGE 11477]|uniref:sulfotransferase domain-containing protein n=1 Tax=cf. Phormidesmis sp. LEGE 11477 TaxID=1828680 RepID=UPI001883005D|nr:sulfotransferase domain-containing protein [cf. Phormidesmis sp. LEGE 11477]MBE9059491.1 sulfotransferase domain-containing protein [cf. Phormidesmis sp. LEGE 11477]